MLTHHFFPMPLPITFSYTSMSRHFRLGSLPNEFCHQKKIKKIDKICDEKLAALRTGKQGDCE